ncbi:MAG: ankyrin repeat domain-containing protein [Steroidobacteraceae bacterium]
MGPAITVIVVIALVFMFRGAITTLFNATNRLHEAIKKNELGKIRQLTDAGANVNELNASGYSPLHLASSSGINIEILRLLLAKGAEVDARSKDHRGFGFTSLIIAAGNDNLEVTAALLEAGASVNTTRGDGMQTPLMSAAGQRAANPQLVKLLLRAGADIRGKGKDGKTALICACQVHPTTSSDYEVVCALLEAGSEVNAKTDGGWTALIYASAAEKCAFSLQVVQALLSRGANIDAKTSDGKTPLLVTKDIRVRALLVQAASHA